MFRYIKNVMGIKEKQDLEIAVNTAKEVDKLSGDALAELADIICGNMDAITELGAIVAELSVKVDAIQNK